MSNCTRKQVDFANLKRRKVIADFDGGDITSDAGGALLLRQAEKKLGLLRDVSKLMEDPRDQSYVRHSQYAMLMQRVFGIALGYEDLNDHTSLRHDLALQTSADRDESLASPATLGRLESRSNEKLAWTVHQVMVEKFIESFDATPKELVLDFDATDDPVHGKQEGRFFHGYYNHYCFLPLYVFCESQLLVSYLRPSNIDGAKHSWAILSLLVKRFREVWPDVKIIFRGDSGFCRHRMLEWCDRNDVGYVVGLAKNNVLLKESQVWLELAEEQFKQTKNSTRVFGEFLYAAKKWKTKKRVIAKAEQLEKGSNPRFVVTNLQDDKQIIYEQIYCARGDMENRIKEQQLGLFADRTSSSKWWSNQMRLLLSSLAYVLIDYIRRNALQGTECAKMQAWTLRNRLFKIGAVIIRNTRRVHFMLSSSFPLKNIFLLATQRLHC